MSIARLMQMGAIKTPVQIIETKAYTPSTTSASFDVVNAVGGGSVSFTGHTPYSASSTWGPHQLFDGTRTINDYCSLTGTSPLFNQFVFPRSFYISSIFVIPRPQNDNFPTSIDVIVDNNNIGTFSPTTLTSDSGQSLSYSGTGYKIQPKQYGTTWKLEFPDSAVYLGELEFWGTL